VRPLRAAPLVRNGRGGTLPFLGGDCGPLGGSCGHPELPRRGADEAFEVTGVSTGDGPAACAEMRVADGVVRPLRNGLKFSALQWVHIYSPSATSV
jgi:hypothetical protein